MGQNTETGTIERTALWGWARDETYGKRYCLALAHFGKGRGRQARVWFDLSDDDSDTVLFESEKEKAFFVEEALSDALQKHNEHMLDCIYLVEALVGDDGKVILDEAGNPVFVKEVIFSGSGFGLEEFLGLDDQES